MTDPKLLTREEVAVALQTLEIAARTGYAEKIYAPDARNLLSYIEALRARVERLGEVVDRVDTLKHALMLPLSADLHMKATRELVEDILRDGHAALADGEGGR